YAYSVQQTSDGYIVAGYTNNSANNDMWLVKVNENKAPVLSSIGDKSVNENDPLTFTITANDVNSGDILTYTSDNLPTGATLNDSTGVFSWTPSGSQSGVYSVNFTVSDGNLTDSEMINITVNNVKTGGGSSGGTGTAVIIPIQEETEEEEENTASGSNVTNNATIVVPDEETPEDEVIEETQDETEATPGFSIMLTTGILLSAYVINRRKD
ncbi:hypothetical protein HNV12_20895, partial [Methanococcoides sp. SA1]|nr:hypothetical protein [Methanococcoides sp. SA1]